MDTDIWGHLRFGLDTLASRSLPVVDPYSFTSTQPWVNHEWLSQVLFAFAFGSGGVPLLILYRVLVVSAFVWVLATALRQTAWPMRDVLLAGVVLASVPLLSSVRPQIHSLPLYALTLVALSRGARWTPLVFVAWTNLHGGWMLGAGAVAVHALLRPSVKRFALCALCLGATLVNPYGIGMWRALLEAVIRGWSDVSEWQPITELSIGVGEGLVWLVTAGVGLWAVRQRRPTVFAGVWTVLVAAAAFRARRHVPFFAVTTVMLLAAPIAGAPARLTDDRWNRQTAGVAVAALLAFAMAAGRLLWPSVTCLPPLEKAGIRPEASAVEFIKASGLRGRVLMWFDWGLYAVWHVSDQLRVSIDNRRETVYAEDVVAAHGRFYRGEDPDYPNRLGADYVWIPIGLPPVDQLKTRGWFEMFTGPESTVLGRHENVVVHGDASTGVSCFPAP